MPGPLSGYKIIELAGIEPGPYAGQLFANQNALKSFVLGQNGRCLVGG